MAMQKLGRILFENADGQPFCTAYCSIPVVLRPTEFQLEEDVYHQVGMLQNGMYRYRWERRAGFTKSAESLSKFRTPDAKDWDGPAPKVQPKTREDLDKLFQTLMKEEYIPKAYFIEFYQLASQLIQQE
jgi:hypothetical protein